MCVASFDMQSASQNFHEHREISTFPLQTEKQGHYQRSIGCADDPITATTFLNTHWHSSKPPVIETVSYFAEAESRLDTPIHRGRKAHAEK